MFEFIRRLFKKERQEYEDEYFDGNEKNAYNEDIGFFYRKWNCEELLPKGFVKELKESGHCPFIRRDEIKRLKGEISKLKEKLAKLEKLESGLKKNGNSNSKS